ncbi:MAG: PilN domain-containing protein [Planctomycetota bacterium]|nr:PilN domain-containing protein [Planctomycetota bacterium]
MSTINLLPEDYLENRARRRIVAMCAVLFVVEVVCVVGAWFVTERKQARAVEISRHVDESYADAAQQIARLQQLEVQKKTMLRKAEVADALVERVPRSALLAVLTNALPAGASLTQIKLETQRSLVLPRAVKDDKSAAKTEEKKTRLTSEPRQEAPVVPSTVSLEVKGLAATDMEVARFIAELARCPLIRSVDLGYSQQRTLAGDSLREFQVRIELKENADAIALVAGEGATKRDKKAGDR